ncbi:hypothetical protein [Salinarchaeum laminariae]|uniref:hypothetical protein n=1 Tax=Salinarchaeum laminariae TaxID=869888 RepID=UPI0020BF4D95|nr:hypothetical protein [Salinarchaeum laminariae]
MTEPDPPDPVPDAVADALSSSSAEELRATIRYAHHLLWDHPSVEETIEPRPDEEILRIEDVGTHHVVVAERADNDEGPIAYRVQWEPRPDEEGGTFTWDYLGPVGDEEA